MNLFTRYLWKDSKFVRWIINDVQHPEKQTFLNGSANMRKLFNMLAKSYAKNNLLYQIINFHYPKQIELIPMAPT